MSQGIWIFCYLCKSLINHQHQMRLQRSTEPLKRQSVWTTLVKCWLRIELHSSRVTSENIECTLYTAHLLHSRVEKTSNTCTKACGAKFHKKNATCESGGARLRIQPGTLVLVVQIQIQNCTAVQICKYNILKLAKTWSLYAFWHAAVHFSWQKCILYDLWMYCSSYA